jgi:hypothetical protein
MLDELLTGLLAVLTEMDPASETESRGAELRADVRLGASRELRHLTER